MKSTKSKKRQLRPKLSGTVAGVRYTIGVPDPITGQPSPNLEFKHLKALMILLSWARSPEKLGDWFLVSADEFTHIIIGEEDGIDLLFPLLRSWVRTSRPDEAPEVSQFAAIVVIDVPQCPEYEIGFCGNMVPVLQSIYADIYRDHGLHPNTPVLDLISFMQ
jgi:hypothetical protein